MKKRIVLFAASLLLIISSFFAVPISAQGPRRIPAPKTRYYQRTVYLNDVPCTVVVVCTETYTDNSGNSIVTYNVNSAYLYNSPGYWIFSDQYDGSAGVGTGNQLYISVGVRSYNENGMLVQRYVPFLIEGNSLVNG